MKMKMTKENVTLFDNGDKHWYFNDELYREDGPAVGGHDGTKVWYRHGEEIRC